MTTIHKPQRCVGVLTAIFLSCAGLALAQDTTGTLTGRIIDAQQLPMPGVTVSVAGPKGTQETATDAEGRFRVPFLTPGSYTVRATLDGFATIEQPDVVIRLGQTIDLPLTMAVAGLTQAVEVRANAALVDRSSTTAGSNLSAELLQSVPVGRRLSDALYLAPGVSSSGGAGQGNPSIAGGSGLENQYVIDGINITNAGYGALGSYSIVFGSLGNGTPFDFIQEVQVKTGGYEAEYGQSTGGIVNVITKSGTNQLRGSAFGYVRLDGLEGDFTPIVSESLSRVESVNTTATSLSDVGLQVGGPIVRDRAFWFAAIDPQWETHSLVAPSAAPLSGLGDVDRERRIFNYAAKGTFQLAGHRIDASFFGDPAEGDMGPQRAAALLRTDTAGFSELTYGGHNQTVRYEGVLSPTWFFEASVARADNSIQEVPSVNEWSVEDQTGPVIRRSGGIGFYEVGNDGVNLQFQGKSTHYLGDHQLRYGALYEDITYDNIIQRTGPAFTLHDGTQTVTGAQIVVLPDPTFGRIFRVTRANTGNVRDTKQRYLSAFVQDTWKVGERLTIKPGLRYEQQELVGNLSEFKWDNNWAPRIGATYDLLGSGRSKLHGNWGRYFTKVPNDLAARALSADAGVTRADYFDANLTRPIPAGVAAGPNGDTVHYITAGLSPSAFDPDSKSSYMDEALVGFEFEAAASLTLGARYIHRSFGRILEDVGTVPLTAYFLFPEEAGNSVEYFITNPDENTPVLFPELGASFEKAIHDYDAVEVTVDKRFGDHWQLQGSYRWSKLDGTFEGFFRNDNGQSDPAITSLFDFPTNDPSYAAVGVPRFGFGGDIRYLGDAGAGPLPNDRTHQVKVYGNYSFDIGLNLGGVVTVGSGRPLTAFAANPVYDSAGEIPLTPRGGGFQTEEGLRVRAPIESEINVHADYGFRFNGRRLVLLADVFNLFDRQSELEYDDWTEISFGSANPDFGRILAYQTPRQIRLGLRYEF